MLKRTKNLSVSVIRDALAVVGSIHSRNAPWAVGYAFTKRKDGRGVFSGTFINSIDIWRDPDYLTKFDGYLRYLTPKRCIGVECQRFELRDILANTTQQIEL